MFDEFSMDIEDEGIQDQANKKREEHVERNSTVVHSSLDYHTIKVPPLVEYNSIDNYCEKRGEKYGSAVEDLFSGLGSISGLVVFRTPQPPRDTLLPRGDCQPYCFFSVEELSLVTSLTNWTNKKVCPVGTVKCNRAKKEWHLNSLGETGSWRVLLDVSDLKPTPPPIRTLQIYGILDIHNEKPKIIVRFFRNLGITDKNLFLKSYKLMEKHVPKSIKRVETCSVKKEKSNEDFGKKEWKNELRNEGSSKEIFEESVVSEY